MQCIKEIVNTNSWQHTCHSDVPLSARSCSTVTDYTMEGIHSKRTRSSDVCTEQRTTAEHTCSVIAEPENCVMDNMWSQGGIDFNERGGGGKLREIGRNDAAYTRYYRFGTPCDNCWNTGYYSTSFNLNIYDHAIVEKFMINYAAYDDQLYIRVNDEWVWTHGIGSFDPTMNQWGYWVKQDWYRKDPVYSNSGWGSGNRKIIGWNCYRTRQDIPRSSGGDSDNYYPGNPKFYKDGCPALPSVWVNKQEWDTNWRRNLYLDLRPYLKEGVNTIRIDVGVVDKGEGWIDFEISGRSLKCPIAINECSSFESAAQ